MHGYLGLILNATQYEHPFCPSGQSGPFDPQESSTEAQINATCDVWKESHHTFHLCQAVEKALISQVVSAVEPSGTDEVMTSIYCDVYSYT